MSYEINVETEQRFNETMEQLDEIGSTMKELTKENQKLKQENENLKQFQEKGWEQVTSKKTLVCLFVVFSILLYGV